MAEGFLGGVGSTSQFQSANTQLPILPYRTNDDLLQRIAQARGETVSGVPLLPSWERSYAWAPGIGVDAVASGITWTDTNAGLNPTTGLIAPLLAPGKDFTAEDPIAPAVEYKDQGLGAMLSAPFVLSGDCSTRLRQKTGH